MRAVFTISICKLNRFITIDKDNTKKINKCDVIYKIDCKDCEAMYVGQIKTHVRGDIGN